MSLFHPEPAEGCAAIADSVRDRRAAHRCGQYRVGAQALYYPSGRYVPLHEITSVAVLTDTLPHIRESGFGLPVPALAIQAGGQRRVLLASNRRQIQQLVKALTAGQA